jgi:glycosyltransferase involved in cell wall biosynthesis
MPTRVALITPPLEASGGIGRLMSYVVAEASAEDASIRVLDPRGRSANPLLSIFPLARAWTKLVSLALSGDVDVAHINISSHGSSIRKPIMLWTARLLRVPVVLHLHASEYPTFFAPLPRIAKSLLRSAFSGADLVLVLGSSWKDYVCNELAVPAEKVKVLLNAAPGPDAPPDFAPRAAQPLQILFLGRLGERKGVPELLRALADPRVREQSWLAVLAGDGDVARYRAEAERLGIGARVSFPGWVDAGAAHKLLADSHMLVLPSRAEGLPMSIVEAFAYGVPVISTPVGAIADVVETGTNGQLVQLGDEAQLAEGIATLINDEPLRLRLAQGARSTWEQRLDIAAYARALVSCWHDVHARSSGGVSGG